MNGQDPTSLPIGAVRLIGILRCATETDAATVRRNLPNHERLSRAEPGCISFEVTPTDDPFVWQVEEIFTDRAAFDFHQTRTRASDWFRATRHIERDYRIMSSA